MKSYNFVPSPRLGVLSLSALIILGLAVHAVAITSTGAGRIRGFEGVQVVRSPTLHAHPPTTLKTCLVCH